MFNFIFIILFSFYNPYRSENRTVIDVCDVIELNYCYDKHGNLTLTQFIFRKWSRQLRYHYILDYRMKNEKSTNNKIENPIKISDSFVLEWNDGSVNRLVRSKRFIITHTDYDPEVREKQYWHYLNRRELTK